MHLSFLPDEEAWFAWQLGSPPAGTHAPATRRFRLPEGETAVSGYLVPPVAFLDEPEHATPGARFWKQVQSWADSLLARERWLPLLRPADSCLQAYRAACLDLSGDAELLEHFLAHMPGCALFPWEDPRSALQRALDLLLEARAQERLAEPVSLRLPRAWPEEARSWAEAHAGLGELPLERAEVRLARDLVAWSERLVGPQGAWRTCFTLEEPGLEEEGWGLRFGLQARAESSLILEARDVWNGRAARLAATAGHPLERPKETLLTDLGRSARWCPELALALRERAPERAELDLAGASRFLRETAWLLQESGYAVRLPSALNRSRPRLKLRASRRGGGGGGSGTLTLDRVTQFSWEAEVDGQPLSVKDLRRLAKAKQPLVRHKGRWMLLEADSALRMLEAAEQAESGLGEALRVLARQDVEVDFDLEEALGGLSEAGQMEALPAPPALQATLRPYQVRGYSWLAFLSERGLGACLADDMGLGKTIQLLSLVLRDRSQHGPGPILLVCPTSVLGNWQREVARFAPDLPVRLYYGGSRTLELADHPLILTSFSLVQRDLERLREPSWRGLVLDEAQNIKNSEALQSRAVRQIAAQWKVALTGTPVENRLQELWSLMEFLNPGLLGNRSYFQRTYARPIEKDADGAALSRLQTLVRPFLLRRLKSDPSIVPDLPAKQEIKTYCRLTSEQSTLYAAVLEETMEQIEKKEGVERRGLVLKLLLQLKQICGHPALFLDDASPLPERSGKLERLEEMLLELRETGQAALIFSQFARFAEKLADYLGKRLGRALPCLHGGLAKAERDRLVEEFQREDGPPVLVLSLKAGGVGLNLTRASRVFHFDRWWNPAVENQATDRAYRIGQKQAVLVYKFIVEGTLEETIDALIDSKQALAQNVLSQDESWLTELDNASLRELLRLRRG